MELHETVAELKAHQQDNTRRIEKLESDSQLNHELLNEIKIMNINTTNQMANISTEIGEVKQSVAGVDTKFDKLETKVDELEHKPEKTLWRVAKWLVIFLAGGIGGKLLDLVFSVV